MVICLLGYLQGGEKDNVTDLPRIVRDNVIFGYNVSRDNILAIIPWTNNVVEHQTQITERNAAVDETEDEGLYEDWARYDDKLRDRWIKIVQN